jgi:hypothetical protein
VKNKDNPLDGDFLRSAVLIRKHPHKPLDGNRVALVSNREPETDIEGDVLGRITKRANALFDIESYATGLRLGIVYFDGDSREAVGVSWENSPQPHNTTHGAQTLAEPVEELPEDITPVEDLPELDP